LFVVISLVTAHPSSRKVLFFAVAFTFRLFVSLDLIHISCECKDFLFR